jgi:hypothetical protein
LVLTGRSCDKSFDLNKKFVEEEEEGIEKLVLEVDEKSASETSEKPTCTIDL